MTIIPFKRFLFVQAVGTVGQSIDPDRYAVDCQFWPPVASLLSEQSGPLVSADEATRLADLLDGQADDEAWRLHRSLFGDDDGQQCREFTAFLRRGGFVVMSVSASNPNPVSKLKTSKSS